MSFQKYSGKTLEEALTNASLDKGVSSDELTYNITEEKSGFLGIGKSVEIEVYCEKDVEAFIQKYIETYFKNAQMNGSVEIINENGFYKITVNTSNNAILIGKGGKTLQAFNRLVKAAASAEFKKRVGLLIDEIGRASCRERV